MKKVGRNDPCPCGSGKKFKKCCEHKMLGGKYMAQQISSSGGSSLTSFFQKRVGPLNIEPKEFKASTNLPSKPKEEAVEETEKEEKESKDRND